MADPRATAALLTPPAPGAIAILRIAGPGAAALLAALRADVPRSGRPALRRLVDPADGRMIDEAVVAPLDDGWLVMPHGGTAVVARLLAALRAAGAVAPPSEDVRAGHPEATDELEALALATLARSASPLAIDLLLDQPRRWRGNPPFGPDDAARSRRLDRLVDPPLVVLAGAANIGKSTLTNALAGRTAAIAHDAPGTTRDAVGIRLDAGGLVLRWLDTPGLRTPADEAEAIAQERGREAMHRADLLIELVDARIPAAPLPRPADLRVAGRSDLGTVPALAIALSARRGTGLEALIATIREALVPVADLRHPGPWRFDERLSRESWETG